jgi:hypothetical protein
MKTMPVDGPARVREALDVRPDCFGLRSLRRMLPTAVPVGAGGDGFPRRETMMFPDYPCIAGWV